MYKLLLCWRYLKTRYIALVSIVSVTLGVATMIVVNSVMAGFKHEMQDRIHAILSDVVFESRSLNGFPDPEWHMEQIERVAGEDIAGMTPTVHVPAMLNFQYAGQWITRPIQLIGIDENHPSRAGAFHRYLQHPENRRRLSFDLKKGGYDSVDPQATGTGARRVGMDAAGWTHRRAWAAFDKLAEERHQREQAERKALEKPVPEVTPSAAERFATSSPTAHVFDPETEQHTGAILGFALASYRAGAELTDHFLTLPGDDVKITFPNAATPPRAVDSTFTVVDFYESKMSEYDSTLVFVPMKKLQELRGMIEPQTGVGYVTSIQIDLKDEANGDAVRDKLRKAFGVELYDISTWRDKQGPLLAAVEMETAILNLLLFMIVAVAGFGILAIFFMIVVEKTRDIGILKSLGASGGGIMGIFLGYGLSLGVVGSGVGMVLGLLFVVYINEIAGLIGMITGQRVFDPSIYYFYKIPAIIEPATVAWIVVGALAIAILASVLPARRAAGLHPVEALRYE